MPESTQKSKAAGLNAADAVAPLPAIEIPSGNSRERAMPSAHFRPHEPEVAELPGLRFQRELRIRLDLSFGRPVSKY
jgi:hypothetical protein